MPVFWDQHLVLGVTSSRFTHVVAGVSAPLLLWLSPIPPCGHTTFRLSISERTLCRSPILARGVAPGRTGLGCREHSCVTFCADVVGSSPLGVCLGVGPPGCMVILGFTFYCQTVVRSGCPVLFPPAGGEGSSFSTSSPTLVIGLFLIVIVLVGVKSSLMGF